MKYFYYYEQIFKGDFAYETAAMPSLVRAITI